MQERHPYYFEPLFIAQLDNNERERERLIKRIKGYYHEMESEVTASRNLDHFTSIVDKYGLLGGYLSLVRITNNDRALSDGRLEVIDLATDSEERLDLIEARDAKVIFPFESGGIPTSFAEPLEVDRGVIRVFDNGIKLVELKKRRLNLFGDGYYYDEMSEHSLFYSYKDSVFMPCDVVHRVSLELDFWKASTNLRVEEFIDFEQPEIDRRHHIRVRIQGCRINESFGGRLDSYEKSFRNNLSWTISLLNRVGI